LTELTALAVFAVNLLCTLVAAAIPIFTNRESVHRPEANGFPTDACSLPDVRLFDNLRNTDHHRFVHGVA